MTCGSLFERQAAWQERQRHLSWPEKVRMVEAIRETLLTFRRLRAQTTPSCPESTQSSSTPRSMDRDRPA